MITGTEMDTQPISPEKITLAINGASAGCDITKNYLVSFRKPTPKNWISKSLSGFPNESGESMSKNGVSGHVFGCPANWKLGDFTHWIIQKKNHVYVRKEYMLDEQRLHVTSYSTTNYSFIDLIKQTVMNDLNLTCYRHSLIGNHSRILHVT